MHLPGQPNPAHRVAQVDWKRRRCNLRSDPPVFGMLLGPTRLRPGYAERGAGLRPDHARVIDKRRLDRRRAYVDAEPHRRSEHKRGDQRIGVRRRTPDDDPVFAAFQLPVVRNGIAVTQVIDRDRQAHHLRLARGKIDPGKGL